MIRFNKRQLSLLITIICIITSYFWQSNQANTASTTAITETKASSLTVVNDKVADLDQTEPNSPTQTEIKNPEPSQEIEFYSVTKVIDGDTLEILYQGQTEKVRLIGVNTPETVDPRKTVECLGKEASDFSKATLSNQSVRLEFDPSQDQQDKYGRLLAYIYLSDGRLFNLELITQGYAYEYTYKKPHLHQTEFRAAQAEAQTKQLGLWSKTNCPDR